MPPLRHRDHRALPSPLVVRRITKGLSIDTLLANRNPPFLKSTEMQELDIALAAKENELSSLTSPGTNHSCGAFEGPFYRLCHPTFPEVIDSFQSFNAMKIIFLTYLTQNHQLSLVPESKLYRSVYFPYGSTLQKLIDGDPMPSLQLPLPQLSLLDRYWQFRISAYRETFVSSALSEVRKRHAISLAKQITVDIHPIFGSYILYMLALEARSKRDLQECRDQLDLAMEWIEFWRLRNTPTDLAQMMYAAMGSLRQRIQKEETEKSRFLKSISPEDWMSGLRAEDIYLPPELRATQDPSQPR